MKGPHSHKQDNHQCGQGRWDNWLYALEKRDRESIMWPRTDWCDCCHVVSESGPFGLILKTQVGDEHFHVWVLSGLSYTVVVWPLPHAGMSAWHQMCAASFSTWSVISAMPEVCFSHFHTKCTFADATWIKSIIACYCCKGTNVSLERKKKGSSSLHKGAASFSISLETF